MFRFKQFSVDDSRCGMKVGTDGVLLGAWAGGELLSTFDFLISTSLRTIENVRLSTPNILDIGTGCGLIALMLAQRFPEAQIIGIDINADAAAQAANNFAASPWTDRLTSLPLSLQNFAGQHHERRFDLIVSNPPFFSGELHAPDYSRSLARHNDSLSFDELFSLSSDLLTQDGTLALILPADIVSSLLAVSGMSGLHPTRLCHVFSKATKPERRTMIELCKNNSHIVSKPTRHTTLILESDNGHRSEQYSLLTRDFYL